LSAYGSRDRGCTPRKEARVKSALKSYSTFTDLLIGSAAWNRAGTYAVDAAIAGTLGLSRHIFDRWGEFKNLSDDLCECCEILKIRTGLDFAVSAERLTAVHTAWKRDCDLWLQHLLPTGTTELSHLKKAAILLAKICEFVPIEVSGTGYQDKGVRPQNIQDCDPWPELPNKQSKEQIRKFKDGGCHYVGWLILYHVCAFFEKHRPDRTDPFDARITEDFETDMVSGLLSRQVSAQSLHLIFKALFLRD